MADELKKKFDNFVNAVDSHLTKNKDSQDVLCFGFYSLEQTKKPTTDGVNNGN